MLGLDACGVNRLWELVAEQRPVDEFAEHNITFLLAIRMAHIRCQKELRRGYADIELFGIEPGDGRLDDERIFRSPDFERRPPDRFTFGPQPIVDGVTTRSTTLPKDPRFA